MNYREAVTWLENRNIPLGEFTLDNIKELLKIFDKPQDKLKIIGNEELDKKLTVKASKFTKSAKASIEAAGGVAEEV